MNENCMKRQKAFSSIIHLEEKRGWKLFSGIIDSQNARQTFLVKFVAREKFRFIASFESLF